MPYADTDFFIAIMRDDDRLNPTAKSVFLKYKGSIWTSIDVVIELILVAKRSNALIPAERLVRDLMGLAKVEGVDTSLILIAASYIDKHGVSIFDAFHAASCRGSIISSDHIYDNLKIERIKI